VDEDGQLIVLEIGVNKVFFSKRQAEMFVGGRLQLTSVQLTKEPPEDRAWIQVPQLDSVWKYVSFNGGSPSYLVGGRWLHFDRESGSVSAVSDGWATLATWTAVALSGFVILIVFLAWKSMRVARSRISLAGSVAHELRTPLAGQRVLLETTLERKGYDEEYLDMALRENERLGNLSEEFLTFSRLERGILELNLRPLDLSELVESGVYDFKAEHEGGEIVIESDKGVLAVVDDAAVMTILRNLLENAWKYSEGEPRITVRVFEGSGDPAFSVSDEGVGLSSSEKRKIFRQFYRVDRKLSRSQDGLGLGLSIVRRLVESMDGRISVESEKGRGSCFTVVLQKGGER